MRHRAGLLMRPWPSALLQLEFLVFFLWTSTARKGDAVCVPATGCQTAYAFYRVQGYDSPAGIALKFGTTKEKIHETNPGVGPEINFLITGQPLFISSRCYCINDQLLQLFPYQVPIGASLSNITISSEYGNLTQPSWVAFVNSQLPNYFPTPGFLYAPVNCSCGNPDVNSEYGLFITYPVVAGTGGNITGIAMDFNTTIDILKKFNKNIVWDNSQPTQYAFIPVTGSTKKSSKLVATEGAVVGVIVGAVAEAIVFFTFLAFVLYYVFVYQPKKRQQKDNLSEADPFFIKSGGYYSSASDGIHSMSLQAISKSQRSSFALTTPGLMDYTVDKSMKFSYEELVNATANFNVANKIGEGGFATVFYGEIRGQKLAIKKMNLQATKEFMAELQVLTNVHHTNLVQLIGYCTTNFLFLVYEFVENGTLDHHLHSTQAGNVPLAWSARVQIALDAAQGLEYIHEHTKPTYIHRDIKSANILLDKECHAKVADFGITKLMEVKVEGRVTQPTRVVGTWGYMSPEYARFGEVSPTLDVYSFGVVLFELLSGREAIIRGGALSFTEDFISSTASAKEEQRAGLVNFFDPVLKSPDGKEKLPRFMDPNLGDDYPEDAAWKLVQLAGACTQELPSKRPTMRTAVVALKTLSSTQAWDVGTSTKNSRTTRTA